jgi:hypothetical protein
VDPLTGKIVKKFGSPNYKTKGGSFNHGIAIDTVLGQVYASDVYFAMALKILDE